MVTLIYLRVKPERKLQRKFAVTVGLSLAVNLELMPVEVCGLLAALSSVLMNAVGLASVPELIETKNPALINLSIAAISAFSAGIWFVVAALTQDYFFGVS